jgi:hypothetical protein
VAIRAELPSVPEMNSLIPIAAFVGALGVASLCRRRRTSA